MPSGKPMTEDDVPVSGIGWRIRRCVEQEIGVGP